MQTFLPYPSFARSAIVLDRQRLGKQRVETLQILTALRGGRSRWRRHPAVLMWEGYEAALAEYGLAVCAEWVSRGYRDTCAEKIAALSPASGCTPPWIGGPIHATHRAALLAKAPEHYGRFGWAEQPRIDYHWPGRSDFRTWIGELPATSDV